MPDAVAVHTEIPAVLATHPSRQVPAWWHRLELPSRWCGIHTLLTVRSTCRALRELVGQQPLYEACRKRVASGEAFARVRMDEATAHIDMSADYYHFTAGELSRLEHTLKVALRAHAALMDTI
eukprot:s5049_g1.t1